MRPAIVISLLVLLARCGGDSPTSGLTTDGTDFDTVRFTDVLPGEDTAPIVFDTRVPDSDAPVDTESPLDTAAPDDTEGTDTATFEDADVTPDTSAPEDTSVLEDTAAADASDTAGLDTAEPLPVGPWGVACAEPNAEGCPCEGSADCGVGRTCANTALGKFCAEPCVLSCAGARRCFRATPDFGICLPAWSLLCAPCRADDECLEVGARCVDFGFEGSYCAAPCGASSTCPGGFGCQTLGAGASSVSLCLPSSGTCSCTVAATSLEAATACYVEGGPACPGERRCEAGGLTTCDAGERLDAELCNGKDDTCDNEVDEGFPVGEPCAAPEGGCANGVYACTEDGAGVVCVGAQSEAPEVCNGLDDDCDGSADEGCDDDGDGYCDAAMEVAGGALCVNGGGDCDDGQGGVHPGATETCNNVDDDCDGNTDGMTEACTAACGSGTRACAAGAWSACSGAGQVCDPAAACCQASGCGFQPTSLQCSTTANATERRCSGTCGGTIEERKRFPYCDGTTAGCGTANLVWGAWGSVQACGAANLCTGGANPSCQTCSQGCTNGICETQPVRTICIDPGYGATDGGPVANGLTARDVTWSIAVHLRDWLNSDTANPAGGGRWNVVLTRTTGNDPTSAQRAATCNNAGATRVISIHVNGCCGNSATGAETWRTSSNGNSTTFAGQVHAEVIATSGLSDRGVKSGTAFTVLNSSTAPAAMIFPGFLDNTNDAAKYGNDGWRTGLAKGLMFAIQTSFGIAKFTP